MKKSGILNQNLAGQIAALGHTDCVMICDAGFPISAGQTCIDLALTAGIPSFLDCLNLILQEAIFDEVTYAQEMSIYNKATFDVLGQLFRNHKINIVPQAELATASKQAKFIIRTGELKPYSNILLFSASGVEEFYKPYVI